MDFYLSRNRDVEAAKQFLRKAMKNQRVPAKITLDAYAASHRAVAELQDGGELPKRVRVRSSKYLNNLIEQDHRRVKQRIRAMVGLKSFGSAAVTISGNRVGREDQEAAVQGRQAGRPNRKAAGNLASRTCRVIRIRRKTQTDNLSLSHRVQICTSAG